MESEVCSSPGGVGTSGKLSTVSTLGFSSTTHRLPQDFWTKGVDKSKFILETILNKIKYFEEVTESTWIDFVKENFALDNLRDGNEIKFLLKLNFKYFYFKVNSLLMMTMI